MGTYHRLRTARNLRSHRRDQKWHDKQYKKDHVGTALKGNPFGGASHAKGIVLEQVGVETASFCHQEVCQGPANQEWQKRSQPLYPMMIEFY